LLRVAARWSGGWFQCDVCRRLNAAERNSHFGARRPGDVSHCSIWAAVSACRALRSSRSRSMPGGVPRASFRRRSAWSVRRWSSG